MKYVDVILPLGLEGLYTYSVPATLESQVQSFVRVQVPLGQTKTYTAMVVRVHENTPEGVKLKNIISVIDAKPVLLPQQYRLWTWIADYYMSPIGDVFRTALPTGMKSEHSYRPKTETYIDLAPNFRNEQSLHIAIDSLHRSYKQLEALNTFLALTHWDSLDGETPQEEIIDITREALMNEAHATTTHIKALCERGILTTYEKEVGRLNHACEPHPENVKPLNEYQQQAYDEIYRQWGISKDINEEIGEGKGESEKAKEKGKNVVLLHGVTSSGKTEIYISMIQRALDEGKQVLYLLPEIALTVQITERLQRVFGNRLGIYHSKYSDAERVEIWQKQLSDTPYDVILGARSAVFLPFQRLGLVIVDEEHETSFKQQDPAPRYNGRSAAIVLAQMYGAKTLLGTATPSSETMYNALLSAIEMKAKGENNATSKYGYVRLDKRYKELQLPMVRIVDVKDLRRRKMMRGLFSPDLKNAIGEALNAGEQVILFQNRRGFSPIIECHECGWVPRCTNCDVSLTYHKNTNSLSCHYCGYTYRMPTECPDCHNKELKDRGYGTEKVEDIIRDEFPNARVARMDLDTTRTRNAYERIISDFSSHKTNILVGTQMVTKGLDFDHVSVVGILSADSMLNVPDFRAWEYAYAMMTQVAGRAGRKGKRGLVILQTNHPEMPVIRQVVDGNYKAFHRDLLEERNAFRYPPYTRLIYIYLRHKDNQVVETAGIELANRLRQMFSFRVLGPDRPAVARIKTLCIRKVMLKLELNLPLAATRNAIRQCVSQLMTDDRYKSLQVVYDVDPT